MDRESELNQFKQLNLIVVASAYGYEIVKKKSTRHSILMTNGSDKIIVSKKGQAYVYCSVYDSTSNGTLIDFAQKVIEPGCSMGRVRQLLRPYLSNGYLSSIQQQYAGNYVSEIKPNEIDLAGVAARYSRFESITQPHAYLCKERAVPFELLKSDRLKNSIRHHPRHGSVIFPHWGYPSEAGSAERCLIGYEIKGQGVNMFSKGGRKGLWMSQAMKNDQALAIAESGLDAISYLAHNGDHQMRVASLSGRMNPKQPELIKSAIERMGEGSQIIAAFDNDKAGDELTQKLADLILETGRSDLKYKEDRPSRRGADWNEVLVNRGSNADIIRDGSTCLGW